MARCVTEVVLLIALASCLQAASVSRVSPPATGGQPWPMPQTFQPSSDSQLLNEFQFSWRVTGHTCDILEAALDRYFSLVFYPGQAAQRRVRRDEATLKFRPHGRDGDLNTLTVLTVDLVNECEHVPYLGMDEAYQLSITTGDAKLLSKSIWGILRGLETFSQLVYETPEGTFMVNNAVIEDYPRFSHRGTMLDTSRHFLTKRSILENLEAMSYSKMNVFHWHIVDDQAFPYQSRDFPNLSYMGAYDPYTHVYSQEDIREIIDFARIRGIRVIPEFDSPGHTGSWGPGQPDLLTKCYKDGKATGGYGPVDPSRNSTYDFLKMFMKELTEVFIDKYIHLGGDEVSFTCWQSNPEVQAFMTKKGFGTDYSKLEQYYMQTLLDIVSSYNHGYTIWQEVVDNGCTVQADTVVHVWKGGYQAELAKVTALGHHALLSSPWYLNYISYGSDWPTYYKVEPLAFNGTDAQKKLVEGGEACIWGEYVDSTNLISRFWPRAGAVAERLWSAETVTDIGSASARMEEHRCRLVRRGLNAEPPTGPSFCQYEYGGL